MSRRTAAAKKPETKKPDPIAPPPDSEAAKGDSQPPQEDDTKATTPGAPPVVLKASRWPLERDAAAHFGRHELKDGQPTERWERSQLTTIELPYTMRLSWDPDITIQKIRCHQMVARDLLAILGEIRRHYRNDVGAIRAARMDLFGGCYNYRPKRSSAALSMHAWGAAIDLDPERNGMGTPWRPDAGMMPEAVIDIFESYGWTWGGLWQRSNADPMHFQATQR